MITRVFLALKLIALLLTAVVLFKIFTPRHYAVPPIEKRKDLKRMQLSTGSDIAYNILEGKGNKKICPIIYLHGGPGGYVSDKNITIFSNLAADGYDVFLYDQIGGGSSGRLNNINDYTVDRQVNDLHEIIKKSGKAKVILIAQSWGGVLAAYYVSKFGNDIAKIIFTNPGPIYPYPARLDAVKAPDSLHLGAPVFTNAQGNQKTQNLRIKAIHFFATRFGIKLASDEEADEFETYAGYEVSKSTVYDTSKVEKILEVAASPRSGYYAEIMTFQNLLNQKDPRPLLKDSDIPVLVLKSQYDNQIWGGTNEYLEIFKHHQIQIIPAAGHAITLEQPAMYVQNIRQFLDNDQ
jgi:proline iminopeptidase